MDKKKRYMLFLICHKNYKSFMYMLNRFARPLRRDILNIKLRMKLGNFNWYQVKKGIYLKHTSIRQN